MQRKSLNRETRGKEKRRKRLNRETRGKAKKRKRLNRETRGKGNIVSQYKRKLVRIMFAAQIIYKREGI